MALHMFGLTHLLLFTITQIRPPGQIYLLPRLVSYILYYHHVSNASVSNSATSVCQVSGLSTLHESQTNNLPVNQIDARRSIINIIRGSQFNIYNIYLPRQRTTRVVPRRRAARGARRRRGAQRSRWPIAPVATILMVGIGIGYTLGYM